MINSVHEEEMMETNFAEWYSAIKDSIVPSGLDWKLEEETNVLDSYNEPQRTHILAVVCGFLRKSIQNDVRMELEDHRLMKNRRR